jgi:hypothetical protein
LTYEGKNEEINPRQEGVRKIEYQQVEERRPVRPAPDRSKVVSPASAPASCSAPSEARLMGEAIIRWSCEGGRGWTAVRRLVRVSLYVRLVIDPERGYDGLR